MDNSKERTGVKIVETLLVLAAAAVLLYYVLYFTTLIPVKLVVLVKVGVAVVVGYYAVNFVGSSLRRGMSHSVGDKRGKTAAALFRYLGYLVIAFVALGLAGVSGTELLAGGTFTGLVLGLASQQVLSNVLAGLLIITAKPFTVGSRITMSTWQYGFTVPSYPPKYLSDNLIIPGFTGTVEDITLNYTYIKMDDGSYVKIPNNVVIQAAVVDQEASERLVRIRYEAQKPLSADELVPALKTVVQSNQWVSRPDSVQVYVENITSTSILVSVEAFCKGSKEEPPRSSILVDIEKEAAILRSAHGKA